MSKYRNFYPTVKSFLQLRVMMGVALLALTVRYKPLSMNLCGRTLRRLRAHVRQTALYLLRSF
jgi:hypothetical protein